MKSESCNLSLAWEQDENMDSGKDDEGVEFASESQFKSADDSLLDPHVERQLDYLLNTITRVGGEVCRLRAEVDGLLEQNQGLRTSFDRLREVIAERGQLNMDDFELACDVVQSSLADSTTVHKKLAN